MVKYIVSGRQIRSFDLEFLDKLSHQYNIQKEQIESVFGFVGIFYRLYGGREYRPGYGLTLSQYEELLRNGIHFELALTNLNFNEEMYQEVYPLLKELNIKGNSVISCNDELTKRIKKDCKNLSVRRSIIQGVKNIEELERVLRLYDTVALSPEWNDNHDMLQAIKEKHRVAPFATIGCAYNCKTKCCYRFISDLHEYGQAKGKGCGGQEHFKYNYIFDLSDSRFEGFTAFKLIPLRGNKPVIKKTWNDSNK